MGLDDWWWKFNNLYVNQGHISDAIDLIIEGEIGASQKPTPIRDMMSGRYWRE